MIEGISGMWVVIRVISLHAIIIKREPCFSHLELYDETDELANLTLEMDIGLVKRGQTQSTITIYPVPSGPVKQPLFCLLYKSNVFPPQSLLLFYFVIRKYENMFSH